MDVYLGSRDENAGKTSTPQTSMVALLVRLVKSAGSGSADQGTKSKGMVLGGELRRNAYRATLLKTRDAGMRGIRLFGR